MADPMDDLRQASADVSGVEVLSPAAQAVLDAVVPYPIHEQAIAAALRAAADRLSQEVDAPKVDGSKYAGIWHGYDYLNAIADELDHSCQHLQVAPQVSHPFRFNYNHTTALRSAVDLLIDCVSPDYVASILADYRPGGARNKLARSLYTLIDELQRNNVVIEDVS